MKNITKILSTVVTLLGFGAAVNAQCGNVTVDITTDSWGYEGYWEYNTQGSPCGTGTLGTFANTAVGCAGSGTAAGTDPGAYASSTTITESLGCVNYGCYTINYVDDWGDGGFDFTVYQDGNVIATYTGSGTGGSFDFCVTAPAAIDASISSVTRTSDEYYMIPMNMMGSGITVEGVISNTGSSDVTGAYIMAEVYEGLTQMWTGNSTPGTITSGNSVTETFTSYTPANTGTYAVVMTSFINETDANPANDVNLQLMDVTDTILARDNDTVNGSLGIGAGISNGRLGQSFTTNVNDILTSATALFTAPTEGDSTFFVVYDMAAGMPNSVLTTTDTYVFTAADATNGVYLTLPFNSTVNVTSGTPFVICVAEHNANVTLATNAWGFTAGTNWVTWDGNPNGAGVWSNAEDFGFSLQYILRANFGGGCSVDNSTSVSGADISANATGATYQWLDCDNGNAPIVGETNQTLSTTADGNYAVIVDNGGCADTSACVTMLFWSVNEIESQIGVSPNPTTDKVSVDVPEALIGANYNVVDQMGRVVIEGTFAELSNTVNMKSLDNGVYFIKVEDQNITVRVVKQ